MNATSGDPRTTRRTFLLTISAAAASTLLPGRALAGDRAEGRHRGAEDVTIVEFTDRGDRLKSVRVPKVVKTDAEWRKQLSPLAFEVARRGGTERPFSGAYWDLHDKGLFRCICCDTALFSSAHKFDSGTGWPSFWQPIAKENVVTRSSRSARFVESELTCPRCDAHLGDVFDDGPQPTGLRYCIDSVSLRFVKLA